jgi:hypothetical protein
MVIIYEPLVIIIYIILLREEYAYYERTLASSTVATRTIGECNKYYGCMFESVA